MVCQVALRSESLANGCPRKITDTLLCRMERRRMLAHSGRRTAGSIMHLMVSNSSFCNCFGLSADECRSTSRMAEGWGQEHFLPGAAAASYESLVCMTRCYIDCKQTHQRRVV